MYADNAIAGAYLIGEGAAAIAYSTDKGSFWDFGRMLRMGIGGYLILKNPEKSAATELAGIYLAIEALGSITISPDQTVPFQLGRAGRAIIGTYYATGE